MPDQVDLALELAKVRRLAEERGRMLEALQDEVHALRVVLDRTQTRLARMRTAIDTLRSESLDGLHEIARGLERARR